jgi:hypothetical protein
MLTTLRSRPLALLAGLWFLVAGREPPFEHPCEMGASASVTASQGNGASAEHDEHAHYGHDASALDANSLNAPSDDAPSHSCECVDDCCVSASLSKVEVPQFAQARIVPSAQAQICASASRPLHTSARLLPFANGPPALI